MASTIEHLGKRCDSLQSQIRMAYSTDNVDNRPPAPLPSEGGGRGCMGMGLGVRGGAA